ncbi:Pentalenic acid synthase [Actinoalloteichus hoggarensis]|uniref:Pentalenic acid synthase n=2 Tax=Actinoalloteichus hoggarensis TaxID=1470176 RepID=A0A221W573_9PSEU|nr:Pentalenic acid synthase [Actinoalloteichus hoggarensis]
MVYPFSRPSSDMPAAEYSWLAAHHPIVKLPTAYGTEAWIVTGHRLVREVLSDDRFSARMPGTTAVAAEPMDPRDDPTTLLSNLDPPDHTRLRRLFAGSFTPAQAERLRPLLEQHAERLLDLVVEDRAPRDLASMFVFPFVGRATWLLLDVPDVLLPDFEEWNRRHHQSMEPAENVGPPPEVNPVFASRLALRRNVEALIDHRRRHPGDDLVSGLVRELESGGFRDHAELVNQLTGVVVAAYEPTSNMVGLAIMRMLAVPEDYARLCREPEVIPSAVEEVLRHQLPTDVGFIRVAAEDVEIGGATVSEGEIVIVSQEGAHRDPVVFPEPLKVDIDRRPNSHVAFGHGRHHCLGAPLARVEIATALGVLTKRLPSLRLVTSLEAVPRRTAFAQLGPRELLVEW